MGTYNFGNDLIAAFETGRRERLAEEEAKRRQEEHESNLKQRAAKLNLDKVEFDMRKRGFKIQEQTGARALQREEANFLSFLPPKETAQTPFGTDIPAEAVTRSPNFPQMQRVLSAGLPVTEKRPADIPLSEVEGVPGLSTSINPADIRKGREQEARRLLAQKAAEAKIKQDAAPPDVKFAPPGSTPFIGGQAQTPIPSKPTEGFEGYVKDLEDVSGSKLTPQERLSARRDWMAAGRAPASQSTVVIQTVDAEGNPVTRIVPKVAGSEFASKPTAEQINRKAAAGKVLNSINSIETLSKKLLTKVGPEQRITGARRSIAAALGSDPEYKTYQDSRTALAGNLAVAQQGSRPSDADILRVWLPLVPDVFSDTKESAEMKWTLIKTMSGGGGPGQTGGVKIIRDAAGRIIDVQ